MKSILLRSFRSFWLAFHILCSFCSISKMVLVLFLLFIYSIMVLNDVYSFFRRLFLFFFSYSSPILMEVVTTTTTKRRAANGKFCIKLFCSFRSLITTGILMHINTQKHKKRSFLHFIGVRFSRMLIAWTNAQSIELLLRCRFRSFQSFPFNSNLFLSFSVRYFDFSSSYFSITLCLIHK